MPRDSIGEVHAAPSLPGKPRGQEMNHLLIWLQVYLEKTWRLRTDCHGLLPASPRAWLVPARGSRHIKPQLIRLQVSCWEKTALGKIRCFNFSKWDFSSAQSRHWGSKFPLGRRRLPTIFLPGRYRCHCSCKRNISLLCPRRQQRWKSSFHCQVSCSVHHRDTYREIWDHLCA